MKHSALLGAWIAGLALQAAAMEPRDIEITGFANLGAVPIVCLRVQPGGRSLVLHAGETADGITVKDLDLRNGTALVEWGASEIKLRLLNYCAPASSDTADAAGSSASPNRPALSRRGLPGASSGNPAQGAAGVPEEMGAGQPHSNQPGYGGIGGAFSASAPAQGVAARQGGEAAGASSGAASGDSSFGAQPPSGVNTGATDPVGTGSGASLDPRRDDPSLYQYSSDPWERELTLHGSAAMLSWEQQQRLSQSRQ